jgi:hypothetical protein
LSCAAAGPAGLGLAQCGACSRAGLGVDWALLSPAGQACGFDSRGQRGGNSGKLQTTPIYLPEDSRGPASAGNTCRPAQRFFVGAAAAAFRRSSAALLTAAAAAASAAAAKSTVAATPAEAQRRRGAEAQRCGCRVSRHMQPPARVFRGGRSGEGSRSKGGRMTAVRIEQHTQS